MSIDVGSRRLTESYIKTDPPSSTELSACAEAAGSQLAVVDRELPEARRARTVIGTAGTISTAVRVALGLRKYDREQMHHFTLRRDVIENVLHNFASTTRSDRGETFGVRPGEIDVIIGGMTMLATVMRHFDLNSILTSESDILDGLARSLQ